MDVRFARQDMGLQARESEQTGSLRLLQAARKPHHRHRARRPAWLIACLLSIALVVSSAPEAQAQARVDLDSADAATLAQNLPGIGPVKARRIVEYRQRHGPFGSVDALVAVKGIGPATVARIQRYLQQGEALPASAPSLDDADAAQQPRSSSERERAARLAVQRIVARSRRESTLAIQ